MTTGILPQLSARRIPPPPSASCRVLSFNEMRKDHTDVATDAYTANLAVKGKVLQKLDYEVAYVYNKVKASDGTSNTETTNINFRTVWLLAKQKYGIMNPP